MNLIHALRELFAKPQASQRYEYVRETTEDTPCSPPHPVPEPRLQGADARAEEITFAAQGDLESYVRDLDLPQEAIERWISAGVLLPEETKVASQMIRIIRKNK